jgi:hypothetical protein
LQKHHTNFHGLLIKPSIYRSTNLSIYPSVFVLKKTGFVCFVFPWPTVTTPFDFPSSHVEALVPDCLQGVRHMFQAWPRPEFRRPFFTEAPGGCRESVEGLGMALDQ